MDNIAFRRFKNVGKRIGRPRRSNRDEVLITEWAQPPEFIVEFANCNLFPEGSHLANEGWEIMPEDEFAIELAKNPQYLKEFKDAKDRLVAIQQVATKVEQINQKAIDRETNREFEEFKRWKDSKRLLSSDSNGKK